jgi:ABC-type sugar transport system permease subunit
MVHKHTWRNYLYFIPIAVFIVCIYLYPLIYAMFLAFMQKSLLKPQQDGFIGFANFKRLFTQEPLFWLCLKNGLLFTFFSVVFEYLLGLTVAITLSSRFARMRNTAKALLMLPWAVPIAINSMMWKFLLAPNFGFLGQILTKIGIPNMIHMNWLGSVETVMYVVVAINVWRSFPFYTITLTAGLSSIPRELYEAAEVDGASGWQRFFYVTLPGIKDTSMVIVVFHIIWTFINFDVIYLLTAGGPLNATEVLPTLLYRQAFSNFDMGYASSIGLFIFAVLMIFVAPLYTRFVIRGE